MISTAGAIILKISHGYTIEPLGPDPLVDLAEEGIAQISMAAQPGAFIVDILPFREHDISQSTGADWNFI